ncbi:MAG: exonuclease SbcCD subunit D [Caldilinea sp.]|nr:exonuclease SbcCD subunit D [Caldilinea sp.]MDW8440487.1 exonuclease SbcCD subunit D [Caldilineaceae bacterium]
MKTRFLHCADIHLGYLQYGLKERFNDFAAAFNAVIDKAIGEHSPRRDGRRIAFDEELQGPVDFVILAGDLFHRRSIDALTLNQAIRGLRRLRDKGIPCIAVEGNHERAYYEDVIGWMKFLALQDLIILLDAEVDQHGFALKPWDAKRRQGAYYEPKPGVRIYGMRYFGAGTGAAIKAYAEALATTPQEGVEYSVFVTHAGVEGQLDDKADGVSFRQWSPLRPYIDYVALGHFHKPFQLEDWIYNPGSPEACSSAEAAWSPRGYWWVEVDTAQRDAGGIPHLAKLGNPPRRAFRRYSYKVDHVCSLENLMMQLEEFAKRKALELTTELAGKQNEIVPPVIELYLTGVIPFDRRALDVTEIEKLAHEAFRPLALQVKCLVQSAEQPLDSGQPLPRGELERQVLAGLFRRDVRYAADADRWAQAALALKQLSLSNAPADAILEALGELLRQVDGAEQDII